MSEITFFMIVTPRDAVIGDYALRSYGKLRGLDYRVRVYSNYLLPAQKRHYFPQWERLPGVEILRNDHHDADLEAIKDRIDAEGLEGPFEYLEPIWDRELPKVDSRYVATVDADFEILNPRFLYAIMDQLRASPPDLIGFSTDYSSTAEHFESYKGHTIILHERNHTWFCIYKREAFEISPVSHHFHREVHEGEAIPIHTWDTSAYLQHSLREKGLRFEHLHGKYSRDFVHYGAFSKNTSITRGTVGWFRLFALLEHRLPSRLSRHVRLARRRLVPGLENNRYQWVRQAPIHW